MEMLPSCPAEEAAGVRPVGLAEDEGGGGDVGAGGAGVHLVHGPRRVHVLRPFPARVVLGRVANLVV
jgi:hypothetical protein